MSVKIRLQRHGSKKRPFYFIVAATSTSPRDGKFIEKLGTYNPLTVPATVSIERERALYWLQQGAQPTNTCRRILSFKGVLYLKHLMRGVTLGLFNEITAMEKFERWNGAHEELVAKREESHRAAKQEKRHNVVKESVKKVEERMAARAASALPTADEAAADADGADDAVTATADEATSAETTTTEANTTEAATPETTSAEAGGEATEA